MVGFQRSDGGGDTHYSVEPVSVSSSFFLNSKTEKLCECLVLEKIREKVEGTLIPSRKERATFRSART